MKISQNDWYASFLIPSLVTKLRECEFAVDNHQYKDRLNSNVLKLKRYIGELSSLSEIDNSNIIEKIGNKSIDSSLIADALYRLDSLKSYFRNKSLYYVAVKDTQMIRLEAKYGKEYLVDLKDRHRNEVLSEILLNQNSIEKLFETNRLLVQKTDPVFMKPTSELGRAHFYAPFKTLGSKKIDTLAFNVAVIWLMSIVLFITLYYNSLKALLRRLESLSITGNINKRVS